MSPRRVPGQHSEARLAELFRRQYGRPPTPREARLFALSFDRQQRVGELADEVGRLRQQLRAMLRQSRELRERIRAAEYEMLQLQLEQKRETRQAARTYPKLPPQVNLLAKPPRRPRG